MEDTPLDVRVHIGEDYVNLVPCGVGEPGVSPYPPARVNAIYDATGKRIRRLSLGDRISSA
jgi:isoquinoline 1-oxidoreductase beta subunit